MRRSDYVFAGLLTVGCALLIQVSASSHHSFPAQYDADKPIALTGSLTKLDWRNPHVYFYMDVEEDGEYANWAFEMGSPISMGRLGWTRNSASIGDVLEVEGSLARDGSRLVNARSVVLAATGRRMFAGSSQNQEENE